MAYFIIGFFILMPFSGWLKLRHESKIYLGHLTLLEEFKLTIDFLVENRDEQEGPIFEKALKMAANLTTEGIFPANIQTPASIEGRLLGLRDTNRGWRGGGFRARDYYEHSILSLNDDIMLARVKLESKKEICGKEAKKKSAWVIFGYRFWFLFFVNFIEKVALTAFKQLNVGIKWATNHIFLAGTVIGAVASILVILTYFDFQYEELQKYILKFFKIAGKTGKNWITDYQ